MKKLFSPSIGCFLVFAAHAGGNGSHGGNAVVCFSRSQIVSTMLKLPKSERVVPNSAIPLVTLVRMLDLYEIEGQSDLNLNSKKKLALFAPLAQGSRSAV